jgi:hypothetical protein
MTRCLRLHHSKQMDLELTAYIRDFLGRGWLLLHRQCVHERQEISGESLEGQCSLFHRHSGNDVSDGFVHLLSVLLR